MLKNVLELNGLKVLNKFEQGKVKGGGDLFCSIFGRNAVCRPKDAAPGGCLGAHGVCTINGKPGLLVCC